MIKKFSVKLTIVLITVMMGTITVQANTTKEIESVRIWERFTNLPLLDITKAFENDKGCLTVEGRIKRSCIGIRSFNYANKNGYLRLVPKEQQTPELFGAMMFFEHGLYDEHGFILESIPLSIYIRIGKGSGWLVPINGFAVMKMARTKKYLENLLIRKKAQERAKEKKVQKAVTEVSPKVTSSAKTKFHQQVMEMEKNSLSSQIAELNRMLAEFRLTSKDTETMVSGEIKETRNEFSKLVRKQAEVNKAEISRVIDAEFSERDGELNTLMDTVNKLVAVQEKKSTEQIESAVTKQLHKELPAITKQLRTEVFEVVDEMVSSRNIYLIITGIALVLLSIGLFFFSKKQTNDKLEKTEIKFCERHTKLARSVLDIQDEQKKTYHLLSNCSFKEELVGSTAMMTLRVGESINLPVALETGDVNLVVEKLSPNKVIIHGALREVGANTMVVIDGSSPDVINAIRKAGKRSCIVGVLAPQPEKVADVG